MIFPTLALWSQQDPADAAGQIDRAIDHRNHRLVIGLDLDENFQTVTGSLVISQGHGRYLRVRHVFESELRLPQALSQGLNQFVQASRREASELRQLLSDLAEVQAAVVEKLKCSAGKYVDRVLAIAVRDPGLWDFDFDGRPIHTPLCDPTRLAELSGVSVLDAFPDRDLAVGGSGTLLEALPLWIMFADRHERESQEPRFLIDLQTSAACYFLPRSDGFDATLPEIQVATLGRNNFLSRLIHEVSAYVSCCQDDAQAATAILKETTPDGRLLGCLQDLANRVAAPASKSNSSEPHGSEQNSNEANSLALLVSQAGTNIDLTDPASVASLTRTVVHFVARKVFEVYPVLMARTIKPNKLPPPQASQTTQGIPDSAAPAIYLLCPQPLRAMLQIELKQIFSNQLVRDSESLGVAASQVDSVAAGLLGLLHIDQMPANIPWLTKADSQRILGRLTPGRPSNYRQLLRTMADFHPAPMKLKDAV